MIGGWSAVLFDLDGTLADTVDLILACYRHTMKVHRGEELPDDLWLRTLGRPLRDGFAEFTDDADELAAMQDTYVTFQRTVHDRMARPFEGAGAVVGELAARGVARAVVTSKRREMATRTLGCCGLGEAFGLLVCADDVERGKPHPEAVHRALDGLGLGGEPRRVLFVGDSPFDVAAGRAAGVRTAAATWGPFRRDSLEAERPDFFVDSLAEVLRLAP